MNRIARCLPLLLLASLALPAAAADTPATSTTATDHPEIRAVIESFRTSIIQRDKSRFLALFLQPEMQWQSVVGDASLAQIKSKHPEAVKARIKPDNNPTAFIDGIVKSKSTSEETFDNIRIDADADVATVNFDYTFLSDGRETNRGQESWLLVRNEDGWKITTLAYSINIPAAAGK
jgi:hypothetical protein